MRGTFTVVRSQRHVETLEQTENNETFGQVTKKYSNNI